MFNEPCFTFDITVIFKAIKLVRLKKNDPQI
jgi:hypothetical protein